MSQKCQLCDNVALYQWNGLFACKWHREAVFKGRIRISVKTGNTTPEERRYKNLRHQTWARWVARKAVGL